MQQVAGKADKTLAEIDGLMTILVRAEAGALQALEAGGARDLSGYALVRLPADLAAWKRRLAAILVGRAAASPETAGPPAAVEAAPAAAEAFDGADRAARDSLLASCAEARRQATAVIEGVGAGAWDRAIPAFQAFEAAAKAMVAASEAVRRA